MRKESDLFLRYKPRATAADKYPMYLSIIADGGERPGLQNIPKMEKGGVKIFQSGDEFLMVSNCKTPLVKNGVRDTEFPVSPGEEVTFGEIVFRFGEYLFEPSR